MLKKRIVFLLGPTAIGKSAIAVHLAVRLNAEIVSCDSMQIYRRMDIVTSQPSRAQKNKIKHHLLGEIDPCREYDVASYRKQALDACGRIFAKGKIPLFVGGSGLYYSVIVDGIFPSCPQDKLIRDKLDKQLASKGSGYLFARLSRVDPLSAQRIHPNDSRRIIRALEVYLKSGMPISELQKKRSGLGQEYEMKLFALDMDRQDLYRNIDRRVDKMFRLGLVKEVRSLLSKKLSRTAYQAIGLREMEGYFKGEYGLIEARRLIQRNSRRYAKRQFTWFRKDKRLYWLKIKDDETAAKAAGRIWKKLSW